MKEKSSLEKMLESILAIGTVAAIAAYPFYINSDYMNEKGGWIYAAGILGGAITSHLYYKGKAIAEQIQAGELQ